MSEADAIWTEFLRLEAEAGGYAHANHRVVLDQTAENLGLLLERVRRVVVDRIAGTGAG